MGVRCKADEKTVGEDEAGDEFTPHFLDSRDRLMLVSELLLSLVGLMFKFLLQVWYQTFSHDVTSPLMLVTCNSVVIFAYSSVVLLYLISFNSFGFGSSVVKESVLQLPSVNLVRSDCEYL